VKVKDVIKKALSNIQKDGKMLTPSEFKTQFCLEAKKANIKVDECNDLQMLLSKLDSELVKRISSYSFKSIEELVSVLYANLKRAESGDGKEIIRSYEGLIEAILNATKVAHDKNLQMLSRETQTKIDSSLQPSQIAGLSEKWQRLSLERDEPSYKKLREILEINVDDIEVVSKKALEVLEARKKEVNGEEFLDILSILLVPSITQEYDPNEILELYKKHDGGSITQELKSAIKKSVYKRVLLDKKEVQRSTFEFSELMGIVSSKLLGIVEKNKLRSENLKKLQFRIKSMMGDGKNIDEIKAKLIETADSIESEISLLSSDLQEKEQEINELKKRVGELESNLDEAKRESSIDFLTKVMSKKSLLSELERLEAIFKRHNKDYAIVFFDLDHFKNINDTYGHEAGDKVLASFGQLVKKYTRTEDIIGRYGGEEFIAIITETDKKGAIDFANHVRKVVEGSKFLYKGIRLSVTLSCGVALRSDVTGKDEVIRKADEYLYQAKNGGRNRVAPEL